MGRDIGGLDHLADGARLHQFSGAHGCLHFQPLAVHDGEDALGLGDGAAHGGQLFQRGDAGLIAEIVLAVLHDADAERGTLIGDRRAENKLDRRIVENLILRPCRLRLGIALEECNSAFRLRGVDADHLSSAADHGVHHAVNVVVAHARDGEADGIGRQNGCNLRGLGNLVHHAAGERGSCKRRRWQGRGQACRPHCL